MTNTEAPSVSNDTQTNTSQEKSGLFDVLKKWGVDIVSKFNPELAEELALAWGISTKNREELKEQIANNSTPKIFTQEYMAGKSEFDHLQTKPGVNGLLNMIGAIEGNNQYNALVGNANQHVVDLTSMSIGEVIAYQDSMKGSRESTAVGKYQIIQSTLQETVAKNNISLDERFDPEMQDKLATHLMEKRGLQSFIAGNMDIDTFQKNLSMEWAALPKDNSNKSYYKGVGSNKALISSSKLREQLNQIS